MRCALVVFFLVNRHWSSLTDSRSFLNRFSPWMSRWLFDCMICTCCICTFQPDSIHFGTGVAHCLLLWLWCFWTLNFAINQIGFLSWPSQHFCDSLQRFLSRCSDYSSPLQKFDLELFDVLDCFWTVSFSPRKSDIDQSINQSKAITAWNTRLNFQNVKSTLERSQFFVAKSSEYGFIVCLSRPTNGFSDSQSRDGSGAVGYAGRTSPAVAARFLVGQWCAAVENEDPSSRQENQGSCEDQNGIYR